MNIADEDLPDGAQSLPLQESLQAQSAQARKRDRDEDNAEDSINGPDAVDNILSDSLIGNTSIEINGDRRRRLSSDLSPIPERSSTPLTVSQQMNEIRNAIVEDEEVMDHGGLAHHTLIQGTDSSSVTSMMQVQNMVSGIVSLTREEAHAQQDQRPSLQWDDTGMVPAPLPPSPRPVPHFDGQSNAQVQETNNQPPAAVSSIMEMVRMKLNETASSIETIISGRIEEVRQHAIRNSEEIAHLKEWGDNMEQTNRERWDHVNDVAAQVVNLEVETERRFEDLGEALRDNRGHIDRMEQRMAGLAHQQNSVPSDALEAVSQRLTLLEKRNDELMKEMNVLKERQQRDDDEYYFKTLAIKGFRRPDDRLSVRAQARKILASFGVEDVLHNVERAAFHAGHLRLTFPSQSGLRDAVHWFSNALSQIRSAGQSPPVTFYTLVPPRFDAQKKELQEIGQRMKETGEISRYSFFVKRGELWMKASKHGAPDRFIPVPEPETQQENGMEVDGGATGSSCPICMTQYEQEKETVLFSCGHSFHELCLSTSLTQNLKCPVCRTLPAYANTDHLANCDSCVDLLRDYADAGEDDLNGLVVMASKCHHFHLQACQAQYLQDRQVPYPPNTDTLELIRLNPDMKGCKACQVGIVNPSHKEDLMYTIIHDPNIPGYIDLGTNLPDRHPRPWAMGPVSVAQLSGRGARRRGPTATHRRSPAQSPTPAGQVARARQPQPRQPPALTGGNSQPLERRRNRRGSLSQNDEQNGRDRSRNAIRRR